MTDERFAHFEMMFHLELLSPREEELFYALRAARKENHQHREDSKRALQEAQRNVGEVLGALLRHGDKHLPRKNDGEDR